MDSDCQSQVRLESSPNALGNADTLGWGPSDVETSTSSFVTTTSQSKLSRQVKLETYNGTLNESTDSHVSISSGQFIPGSLHLVPLYLRDFNRLSMTDNVVSLFGESLDSEADYSPFASPMDRLTVTPGTERVAAPLGEIVAYRDVSSLDRLDERTDTSRTLHDLSILSQDFMYSATPAEHPSSFLVG